MSGNDPTGSEAIEVTVESIFAPIFVESVRIQHFRGISDCTLRLDPNLTVLVGPNNSGKSRLLRAIAIGLSAVPSDKDDVSLGGHEEPTIDVVIAPVAVGPDEQFDARFAPLLNTHIQRISISPTIERIAWRTVIRSSREGLGVRDSHILLQYSGGEWSPGAAERMITYEDRRHILATLIETRRDLVEELNQRNSAVRRILDDLELMEVDRDRIEIELGEIGEDILQASSVLGAMQESLESLSLSIDSIGAPSIAPLPVRIENLASSVSIQFDTGSASLPARFHGSGSRSLSSIQLHSLLYDRRVGRDGPSIKPHPVTLIEEPEAHLHPQAQFSLPRLISKLRGQKIVSTHSTHLVTECHASGLRLLRTRSHGVEIAELFSSTSAAGFGVTSSTNFGHADAERLKRFVERPFGELLFASLIVVGDGATERSFLPLVIRAAIPELSHGITVIDPESMGSPNAKAALKMANQIGIPWLVFADSDPAGVRESAQLLAEYGSSDESKRIYVADPANRTGGYDFEAMILEFDAPMCERACTSIGFDGTTPIESFLDLNKGVSGALLAEEFVASYPPGSGLTQWPTGLRVLIETIEIELS